MDQDTVTEILGRLHQKYEEGLEEIIEKFEETSQWMSDICTEITKFTSQSSVLLPKTPTVKRNVRKKPMVETIPEHVELDFVCSSQNVACPSTSSDTRITRSSRARSVNQSVEVTSPVPNKRTKRQASKAAGAKIKNQLKIDIRSKMRQLPDSEFIRETQKIKRLSSHATVEEGERSCKSRRLEQEHLVLPADKQHDNTSINKAQEMNNLETNNIRTNEEELMIYSPDRVTLSVYDDCLPIQEERQKSITNNAPVASAAMATHCDLPGIPNEVPIQPSEGVRPSVSLRVSCSHEVDSVDPVDSVVYDEPQTNEAHILSHPDTVSDMKENNKTAPKSVIVFTEGEPELSSSDTENSGNEVRQSATEQNMSDKEVPVIEVGKTGPNVMRTETLQKSICAKVVDQNVSNDIAPKQWVTSHSTPALHSSPTKKVLGLQKSTHLLRPHACETVRGWMTTFERLHTVSEESTEQIVEPQQTRVTRTKTRAMSKAAAAAAAALVAAESASASQEISISTDLPNNIHAQRIWRASRKSVARAKRITLAKESQELDKREEQEMSKENSMTCVAGLKYTTPHGLQYYEKYKKTPLSALNISNTSAHSGSHGFAMGSSSKGRLLIKKQATNIVVGVESLVSKQTVQPPLEEIREKKEEEMKRRIEKEEEARKKREQKLKEEVEEKRRKREEKMQKVLKAREALAKQKQDVELRTQKKEEKSRQIIQNLEVKMKEHVQQKKQHAQKKAAEIEERRRHEEAARLAKLKEQEEEQRRLQAERKKEQEEAERQHLERSAIEKEAARLREQQTALLAQAQAKLMKEKQANEKTETELRAAPNRAAVLDRTFNVLPSSSNSGERNVPKKMVNVDDYGIDSSGESSEDEDRPKRPIPLWSRKIERLEALKKQAWVPKDLLEAYFACEEKTPNLMKMFGVKCVKRTSSAVWRTPPRLSSLPKY